MCSTTGFFVFILKDTLEYSGILPDKKASPVLINRNFNEIKERLLINIDYLNKIIK